MSFWKLEASLQPVLLRREYVLITSAVSTAIMLSQIVFWFKPSKGGKTKLSIEREGRLWLAKTHEDWWNECGLTPRMCKTAAKELYYAGIVDVKSWKFNGAPTNHYWLNEDALLQLIAFHFPDQYKMSSSNSTFCTLPSGQNVLFHQDILYPSLYTENTAENTAETTHTVSATPSLLEGVGKVVPVAIGLEGVNAMAIKPTKSVGAIKFEGKTTDEVLSKFKASKQSVKAGTIAATGASLQSLWKKEYSGVYGGFHANLPAAEVGKLGRLGKALGADVAMQVIQFAVRDWQRFAERAQQFAGISSYPLRPSIGFLLQHHGVALEMLQSVPAVTSVPATMEGKGTGWKDGTPSTQPVQSIAGNGAKKSEPAAPHGKQEPFTLEGEELAQHFKDLGL